MAYNIDASKDDIIIKLPKSSSDLYGVIVIFNRVDNSNNKVVIECNSNDTIDGLKSFIIHLKHTVTFICGSSDKWFSIRYSNTATPTTNTITESTTINLKSTIGVSSNN